MKGKLSTKCCQHLSIENGSKMRLCPSTTVCQHNNNFLRKFNAIVVAVVVAVVVVCATLMHYLSLIKWSTHFLVQRLGGRLMTSQIQVLLRFSEYWRHDSWWAYKWRHKHKRILWTLSGLQKNVTKANEDLKAHTYDVTSLQEGSWFSETWQHSCIVGSPLVDHFIAHSVHCRFISGSKLQVTLIFKLKKITRIPHCYECFIFSYV